MSRRLLTAREQVEMLSPWRTASGDARFLRERNGNYPEATRRLIDAVQAATGVRLDMEDTGGRSFVLSGRLEDGSWITAGEPVDGQNWWDAADRERDERDNGPAGWMVALHHNLEDGHGSGWLGSDAEPYHFHVDEGARNHELPRVVAEALATAPHGAAAGRGPEDRGVDWERAVNPRQEIDDDYGDIFGREGSRRVAGKPTTTDDVIRAVRDQHGIHLDMSNTGGGCYVLEGRLEDGSWLRAADHNDFCYPELADRHAEEERDGEPLGWDVDIYPNEHDPGGTSHDGKLTWGPSDNWGGEPIHSHSDPDATVGDLPRVIDDAFRTMPPGAKQRHQEKLRETLRNEGHGPGSAEWARHFPDEGGGPSATDYEGLINPPPPGRDDEDFGHIFGMRRTAGWADWVRVGDPGDNTGYAETLAFDQHEAPDAEYHVAKTESGHELHAYNHLSWDADGNPFVDHSKGWMWSVVDPYEPDTLDAGGGHAQQHLLSPGARGKTHHIPDLDRAKDEAEDAYVALVRDGLKGLQGHPNNPGMGY